MQTNLIQSVPTFQPPEIFSGRMWLFDFFYPC